MPPRNPWEIPPGFYDPALDAQEGAANRGLTYLRQDTELGNSRAAQDYSLGTEDLRIQHLRNRNDLTMARTRGTEDYGRNVKLLQRSYQQLARRQAEGARAAGVLSPAAALLQAKVRAENQAIEREPLDTGLRRMNEDYAGQIGRLDQDLQRGLGRLGLEYGRGVSDRATALSRATEDNRAFGFDLDAQRYYQANQAGYIPPDDPRRRRGVGVAFGGGGGGRPGGGGFVPGGSFYANQRRWGV